MRSVLVRRATGDGWDRAVGEQQYHPCKSRRARVLGSVGGKMSNAPYYFIAGCAMMGAMLAGIAIDSGADYIRYQAQRQAQVGLLNAMDIQSITQIKVSEL